MVTFLHLLRRCVAVDSAEAPRALIDEADVIVNGAPRLLELLQRLLACTM